MPGVSQCRHDVGLPEAIGGKQRSPGNRSPMEDGTGQMKFVVCGMPRGGTTFFGQLFNVHEEVYCYFMETALFRQLQTFGRDRPFPAENLPLLEEWLRLEFRGALVEGTEEKRVGTFRRLVKYRELLGQHGLSEPGGPGIRVWDEQTFEPFLQEVLDLFRSGLYGRELFQHGLRLLARHFDNVTARHIMGEKTPDNLFFLGALHEADPTLKAFCILREPYSTLESMKRRAHRNEPFFDSAFSKEVLGGIVDYYRFMRAAYVYSLCAAPGSFHVCRFEDLVRDPIAVMERVYAALGLEMTDAAREILPQLSIPTDTKHIGDLDLSATEHRLIEMILGPMLRHFGYAHAAEAGNEDGVDFSEGVIALAGLHMGGELSNQVNDKWMARQAELFLLYGCNRKMLVLNLSCAFPEALGLQEVELTISAGGRELRILKLPPVLPEFSIEIPIDGIHAMAASDTTSAVVLTITSSVSYTPITVSGCGADIRDFSFLVKSCRFE